MMYWQAWIFAILTAVTALLAGCAGPSYVAPAEQGKVNPPGQYQVVRGDTLYGIAWRYGLDFQQIAVWNRLSNPDLIYPGQRLRLTAPGASGAPVPPPPPAAQIRPEQPAPEERSPRRSPAEVVALSPARAPNAGSTSSASQERRVGRLAWRWPTEGQVVRGFEPDVPGRKGIQIAGTMGQLIWAASPGQVVYSGSGLPGYGRLIIVKHSDTLLSAYGYLGKILVREGDSVKIGQPIAEMGASTENRPMLHFEIRQNGKPVNPLGYLPS